MLNDGCDQGQHQLRQVAARVAMATLSDKLLLVLALTNLSSACFELVRVLVLTRRYLPLQPFLNILNSTKLNHIINLQLFSQQPRLLCADTITSNRKQDVRRPSVFPVHPPHVRQIILLDPRWQRVVPWLVSVDGVPCCCSRA